MPALSDRTATWTAAAATLVGFAALGAWTLQLLTRPACPPGFARVVDVDWVGVLLSASLAVLGGVAWVGGRRIGRPWLVVSAAVMLIVAGAVVGLAGVVSVASHADACMTL